MCPEDKLGKSERKCNLVPSKYCENTLEGKDLAV
jgi:hypothetical protein